jgi:hypothetical protein
MSALELRAILTAQRWDSMSAITASKLSEERATSLDYYQGDMSKYLPAIDGRSKAVSMDTSDTIEGMLPTLMDIFAGGEEIVRFEPVGPEDVAAAEQETDYVNHVFMQANPGFLVLYSFIKDALLSKNGIVKVYWESEEIKERETYYDLDDQQFAAILAADDIELIEHTVKDQSDCAMPPAAAGAPQLAGPAGVTSPPPAGPGMPAMPQPKWHDVTIEASRVSAKARVVSVPPEEFGITRHARHISEAGYCFHDVFRSESQLIEQGFDEEQIKKLPSYLVAHTVEEIARDTVNESTLRQGEDQLNTANRLIRVTEHYCKLDYEGDGEPRLYRITTAGEEGHVLLRDDEPDVIAEDRIPFASITPFIITHRFWGRSIADLVKDIQDIKTALLRALLDNLYLHNNPRVEVSEAHATDATLDDLLVARPGGIVRVKQPGGIIWQESPDISSSIYPAMQYLDATREWRTGVSRQGQGVDPNALQNQVATIANQMYDAADKKIKLIARIFAETGIKDMFMLLHATIRKNCTKPQTVRLRNNWVPVDPRVWKTRSDMTVNVALGTGSKAEQLAHLQLIIAAQTQAIMGGLPIVSAQNLFNSATELSRLAGHKDVSKFFLQPGLPPDPSNPANAPIQKPPDPQQALQQAKAQAEQDKVKADAAHQQMKTAADIQFQKQKLDFDLQKEREKALLEMQVAREKHAMDMQMHQASLTEHVMKIAQASGGKDADGKSTGPDLGTVKQLIDHMHAPTHALIGELRKHNAPKRIVRDPHTGRATGSAPVPTQ